MITGSQIRAGRGLLNWTGADLAQRTSLTREAINRIENGIVRPREGSLADIVRVFDENGVEFIENSGVRLKPQGVEILTGADGLRTFFDGVYEYTRKRGGTIMQLGIEEDLFWMMGEAYSAFHRRRMAALVKERTDIEVRAILCEGDKNFLASEYNHYRWITPDLFAAVPFYIYGECLGIMNFQTVPAPTIILHKFPAITNAYRKQFEAMWNLSCDPAGVSTKTLKKTHGGSDANNTSDI